LSKLLVIKILFEN